MRITMRFLMLSCLFFSTTAALAAGCSTSCCGGMGGIHYCDSSAGRFVCKNGDYSACYCTRHAVMDLQRLQGCCLWQGGVMATGEPGLVVCNDGSISEICTIHAEGRGVISTW